MRTGHALDTLGARGGVGRAGRFAGQLWQAPTFLFGFGMLLLVALTSPFRQDWSAHDIVGELADLRQLLDSDADEPATLVVKAENLLGHAARLPRRLPEIHFLAGSAYYRLSQKLPKEQAVPARLKAQHYLEEANVHGVALADAAALQYRLGVILFLQDKSSRRALDMLATSVEAGADRPAEGFGYLVEAYLHMPTPQLDAALAANQKQLDLIDDRDVEAAAQARMTRADLLLRKNQRPEALVELERIGPKASRHMRTQARLLQTGLYEETNQWTRALSIWKELQADADLVPGGKSRVLYAQGVCHIQLEPPDREAAIRSWQDALALGGADGQAAGLRLGELLLQRNPADVDAALVAWTKALMLVNMPSDYHNKRVELARVRDMFEAACATILENHGFEQCDRLVAIYKKVAAPGMAEERLAQAAEAVARDLIDQARGLAGDEARMKTEEATAQFHRAAVAYEQAAAVREDTGQAAPLWRSALCYQAAKDSPRAGAVLEKLVKLERDEKRLAEAWLHLAETSQALGRTERARQAYYKCIEFPSTPFAYRARYQLALDEIAKKNFDQARDILEQNLGAVGASMDREAHEQSLYRIADLLYQLRNFDQAFVYLEKAVQQYPANAEALWSRDRLAESYRKLADQAARKLETAQGDAAKAHQRQSRLKWLERGATTYQELADDLETKSKTTSLSAVERGLLRQALFGAADCRFDLNDASEALRRYQMIQEKYRKQVEGLIACQRIWRCVGVMEDTAAQRQLARNAAQASWTMANADLKEMPADGPAFHGGMGVWRKEDWQNWLLWVNRELNPPSTSARPPALNQ